MGQSSSKKKAHKDPKCNSSSYHVAGGPYGQYAQSPAYPYASHSNITNMSGSGSKYEMSSWKSPGYTPGYPPSITGASQPSSRAHSVPPVVGSNRSSPASSTSLYPRSSNSGSGAAAPGSGDSADRRGRSSEPRGHRSRSSSRNVFYFEPDGTDNRARFTKSPSPTGSWEPTAGPSGPGKSHIKSKFFGSSSSSGSSSRSSSAAPSAGRSTGSSGRSGNGGSGPVAGSAGPSTGRPIIHSTSFVSGYSDQFTPSGLRFKPDSQLEKEYKNYKNEGRRAQVAMDAYDNVRMEIPRRPKKAIGANIAVGGSHPEIKENYTLDEHSRLHGLARTAYQAKRNEANQRTQFNEAHASMWHKKTLQTGFNTAESHKIAAQDARGCANRWRDRTQAHGHYLSLYDQDVSSTGGSCGS